MADLFKMIDIETMSTDKDACILTVASADFDPRGNDTPETIETHLFGPISFTSNEKEGRHFSAGTIEWWMHQDQKAQAALFEGNVVNLKVGMEQFKKHCNDKPKATQIWANSPSFDCVILQSAFDHFNMIWPFDFWAERDCRTIKSLAWPEGDCPDFQAGTAHDARDDVIKQILMVQAAYHILGA